MGAGTGRSNRRSSARTAHGQMAFHERSTISTRLTILNEASRPRHQATPQPQTTFPSNLANRRDVGQRHGSAFSGPTPLNDIFRH